MKLLAMTGYGQEEDLRRSREAGFDHHLVKPVDLGKMWELLGGGAGEGEPAEVQRDFPSDTRKVFGSSISLARTRMR